MMQVAVVKVIDVTCVFDRGVATLWTVLVPLVRMNFWIFHDEGLNPLKTSLIKAECSRPINDPVRVASRR
jgi:hypothetical protein